MAFKISLSRGVGCIVLSTVNRIYPLYFEMRSSGKKNPYLKYGLDSQCYARFGRFWAGKQGA